MAQVKTVKNKMIYVSLEQLIPYPGNSKVHPEGQLSDLVNSILEFGFTKPLLVNDKYQVLAGNGAFAAAKLAGLSEVPIVMLANLSDRKQKALVIADNKIAEKSYWDTDLLSKELNELIDNEYDVTSLGFSEQELDDILKLSISDDELDILEGSTKNVSTVRSHQREKGKPKSEKKPLMVALTLKFSDADYQKVVHVLSKNSDTLENGLLKLIAEGNE